MQADLAALAARVDAVEAKAASLQEQVDAIKAQITDIDDRDRRPRDRIDNLKAGDIRLDPQIGDYINVQQAIAGLIAGDYAQTAAVIISDVPPANPAPGQLWWSSVNGELLLWYDDGDSQQWVAATDTGQGLKDAPYDGNAYARKDGEWVEVEGDGSGGGGGIPEAPAGRAAVWPQGCRLGGGSASAWRPGHHPRRLSSTSSTARTRRTAWSRSGGSLTGPIPSMGPSRS